MCLRLLVARFRLESFVDFQAMAGAGGREDFLAQGSSDVRYLLSSHNVEEASQAKLFENVQHIFF